MRCPYCLGDTFVVDSRDVEDGRGTRRRRECAGCEKRFTTYERGENQLIVVKKDGARERFEREKLLGGILKACEKRPVDRDRIEQIVDKIERSVRSSGVPEITSRRIGSMVVRELLKLDQVAYLRFSSVYNKFETPKEFMDAASVLNKRNR